MTITSRPVPLAQLMGRATRLSRLGLATLLSLGLLLTASACGLNVQTNKPYTPADGVNLDVGSVRVRNLTIVSRTPGEGFLSASMVSSEPDALIAVSGVPIKSNDSSGAPFTGNMPNPIALGPGKLVVLTNGPLITFKSADIAPGLTASVTLKFSKAGEGTAITTIVSGTLPQYATISPTPSAASS